jgi:hypothetical protein
MNIRRKWRLENEGTRDEYWQKKGAFGSYANVYEMYNHTFRWFAYADPDTETARGVRGTLLAAMLDAEAAL